MSYTFSEDRSTLQPCPKCGKTALAQPRENLYRCLWCRFESDVSEEGASPPIWSFLLVLFVATLVILGS